MMKNNIYIFFFLATLLCFNSCKSTKQQNNSNSINKTQQNNTVTATTTTQKIELKDSVYRFIVSFISIGAGTDRVAREKLTQFLEDYNQQIKVNINPEAIKWGREGEVDYCFYLNELTEKQQEQFILQVKETLKSSSLIRYYENQQCKHLRK